MKEKNKFPSHDPRRTISLMRLRMCLAIVCISVFSMHASSQDVSISLIPYIQSWNLKGAEQFSQSGLVASFGFPVMEGLTATFRGVPVSTQGDISRMKGMTDTQLSLKYVFPSTNVVMTLGVNAPTGMVKLTRDEFLTSVLLSNTVFRMQVPQFGQGWNINPGILFAFPITEQAALGLGVSYEYTGAYYPVKSIGAYNPGDEILATAGADVKLSEGETLSFDGIFKVFGKDVLEDEEVFHAGTSITAGAQYARLMGFSRLTVAARYRSKGKSDISVAGQLVAAKQKIEPDNYELVASYSARLAESFTASVLLEGRYFSETTLPVSGITMLSGGVGFEARIPIGISFPATVKYHIGNRKGGDGLSGYEAVGGIRLSF